jgi:heme exporter protein C
MWAFLYQLASPKLFYQRAARWIPWLLMSALIGLVIGGVWGLGFAPRDVQQGDAFRIIYIHVPCAFLSMALYAFMGFLSILLLVWRIKLAGMMITLVAEVGATMTALALVTGSIWGKPMWGTWWIWDARLTSELILLLLYTAILATHRAYQNKEQGDKLVAMLTLVGIIDLPIIHYSVSWWNTLHQSATLSLFSKPHMDASMIPPLLWMLTGFVFYCAALVLMRARDTLLWRERRQSWVQELMKKEERACMR